MGDLSPWHLLILAAVFVVLFGSKKLPDAARSVGRSLRIFKAETRGLVNDHEHGHEAPHPVAVAPPAPVTSTPVAPVTPVQPTVVDHPAPVTVPVDTPRS